MVSLESLPLVDSEDLTGFKPTVVCDRLRGGLLIVEVSLKDATSPNPKFTNFSDTTIRTVLTNDPGFQVGHEKTG